MSTGFSLAFRTNPPIGPSKHGRTESQQPTSVACLGADGTSLCDGTHSLLLNTRTSCIKDIGLKYTLRKRTMGSVYAQN
jgi:hypothetical protein